MFKANTYIDRRRALMANLKEGIVLLLGNDESPMNYRDNTYHFRQDSTFLYYFGIQRPGLAAILDVQNGDVVLFGEEYTVEDSVWMGPQARIDEQAARCGVSMVNGVTALVKAVKKARSAGRKIHYLPPYRAKNEILLGSLLGFSTAPLFDNASIDLIKCVIGQREIKTEEEIEQLHQAVDVSVDMHLAAMAFARPGMTEAEVTAEIHKTAIAAGGNIAFPIIATINGQTLHNHYHGNTLSEGDLFLIDAGYENQMCYAGDLSSTIPVSKSLDTRQKEIYQLSLDAHEAAIGKLKFGVPFIDVHLAACKVIFEGLKSLGLTRGDSEQAVREGAHALFFPCGTGHMLGLDVHDMEDLGEKWVGYNGQPKSTQFGLKSLRLSKPLEVGHAFTIEPGIYFIPELMDWWQSQNKFLEYINYEKLIPYRNFGGIRNEEDFVMTKEGAVLLGKPKPKTIREIEDMRAL